MAGIVLAFAGSIGSGKTTFATVLSNAIGWPRVGFGDYVRQVAATRGLNQTREGLQAIGADLLASGTEGFCQAVLEQANWTHGESLIIDGVRHAQVVTELRKLVSPSMLKLVFVEVDDATRYDRLASEGLTDREHIASLDEHSTEAQVRMELRSMADLHVDGTRSPDEIAAELLRYLSVLK